MRQNIKDNKRYMTKFRRDINEERYIIILSIISNSAKNANEEHKFIMKNHYNQLEILLYKKKHVNNI